MQFLPVSPTETLIREIAYVIPDDRREMKAARYLNWRINRQVNAEDTWLINRVQGRHGLGKLLGRPARRDRSVAAQLLPQGPPPDPRIPPAPPARARLEP